MTCRSTPRWKFDWCISLRTTKNSPGAMLISRSHTLTNTSKRFGEILFKLFAYNLDMWPKLNCRIYNFVPDHHQNSYIHWTLFCNRFLWKIGGCPIRRIVFYLGQYSICFKDKITICPIYVKAMTTLEKARQVFCKAYSLLKGNWKLLGKSDFFF